MWNLTHRTALAAPVTLPLLPISTCRGPPAARNSGSKPINRMKLRFRRAKSPAPLPPSPKYPQSGGVGFDGTGPPRAT